MPAIKKRITAEYLEREQQRSEQNGRGAGDQDDENLPPAPAPAPLMGPSPLKRKAPAGTHLLKGLDGEVLVEKRKRTLPPAELRLDSWLDENLEKKAESTVSVMKLYQFYTDMCQQDATNVLEMELFRHMLKNKFGKEFGLKENSPYMGLLKETKPRKKPVVAPSLGYKMRDLIQEALKASGNPAKGVMFAWVKKFLAAKYPALQIDLRPQFLRSALDREIYAGRVELVKGIGFCGFYRLPGPPDVEEDPPKAKKKGAKKAAKGEEGGESAEDSVDKEGEESDKSQEKTQDSSAELSDDKKSPEAEDRATATQAGQAQPHKAEKKAKKRRRRPAKHRPRHGQPQMLNDVFPLAMTYMAEPKEASFGRIRKYLEKYYGKSDIDIKLKKCMEHGCDTGLWDRVSGSGASGSFQLQVDSFNPEHTESLTDMVCSAIIACTEPKVSSVRLLKAYISEYHPEFNIDTRPVKLRNALERAEKHNQLRRISGIGMGGSFQLVEQFTPSPALLAGDEEEEGGEDEGGRAAGGGGEEVYVVRQTKSGRRAPLEKTQLDFSPGHTRRPPPPHHTRRPPPPTHRTKRHAPAKKSKYVEESSEEEEEEESSEEEGGEERQEEKGYTPRPTKSRGAPAAPPPKKVAVRTPPAKAKSQAAKSQAAKSQAAKSQGASKAESAPPTPAGKKGRQTSASTGRRPPPTDAPTTEEKKPNSRPAAPVARKSTPTKRPPAKKAQPSPPAQEEEEEENYYEVEEDTPQPPTRRGRGAAKVKGRVSVGGRKGGRKEAPSSPPTPDARTPRWASRSARQSLKEADSDDDDLDDDLDDQYVARPSLSRGGRKR